MDGLSNVTNQQQTQTQTASLSSNEIKTEQTHTEEVSKKETQDESLKINSQKDVESLVEKLNEAMSPLETSLKFGVDKDDIYYVSVIDQKTNDIIRRFPAEKGAEFLPKMQEVTGILFDSKG